MSEAFYDLNSRHIACLEKMIAELKSENERLRELLKEVLACPASFFDSRLGYAERQVPVALFDEIRKAVEDE